MSIINKKNNLQQNFFSLLATSLLFFIAACSAETTPAASSTTANSATDTGAVSSVEITQPSVIFETSLGEFTVALNAKHAPKTVENFLQYVSDGFYDGTIFHRVIGTFMIQGGGFNADMVQKSTRAPVVNEADNGLKNSVGTIAMARTNAPDSATSQFFINVANNSSLNHRGKNPSGWGYAVFGNVTAGMDVVNAIKAVPTGRTAGYGDVPQTTVLIKRVYLIDTE